MAALKLTPSKQRRQQHIIEQVHALCVEADHVKVRAPTDAVQDNGTTRCRCTSCLPVEMAAVKRTMTRQRHQARHLVEQWRQTMPLFTYLAS
eukprot:9359557-Karenia_brevis.AAC.1